MSTFNEEENLFSLKKKIYSHSNIISLLVMGDRWIDIKWEINICQWKFSLLTIQTRPK